MPGGVASLLRTTAQGASLIAGVFLSYQPATQRSPAPRGVRLRSNEHQTRRLFRAMGAFRCDKRKTLGCTR